MTERNERNTSEHVRNMFLPSERNERNTTLESVTVVRWGDLLGELSQRPAFPPEINQPETTTMEVSAKLRTRLFPAVDDLFEQIIAEGYQSPELIAALSVFTLERAMDDLPLQTDPKVMDEIMKRVGPEAGQ